MRGLVNESGKAPPTRPWLRALCAGNGVLLALVVALTQVAVAWELISRRHPGDAAQIVSTVSFMLVVMSFAAGTVVGGWIAWDSGEAKLSTNRVLSRLLVFDMVWSVALVLVSYWIGSWRAWNV